MGLLKNLRIDLTYRTTSIYFDFFFQVTEQTSPLLEINAEREQNDLSPLDGKLFAFITHPRIRKKNILYNEEIRRKLIELM